MSLYPVILAFILMIASIFFPTLSLPLYAAFCILISIVIMMYEWNRGEELTVVKTAWVFIMLGVIACLVQVSIALYISATGKIPSFIFLT